MATSQIIAAALTVLLVMGLVVYRLLWAGEQVAGADGLQRFPKFPKKWRRWLFGERHTSSN
ncbi:MAG: hypothetical protein WAN62_21205 [Candidatus Acidiferrum sp.]